MKKKSKRKKRFQSIGFECLLIERRRSTFSKCSRGSGALELQRREIHLGESDLAQNLHLSQKGKQERE